MASRRVAPLLVLATAFAALGGSLASAPAVAASPARAIVRRTLKAPGTYRVAIRVSTGSHRMSKVRLSIDRGNRLTVAADRTHHASVVVSATVKSRKLVVRAVDSVTATVKLKVATQPLKSSTGPGTTSGSSGGSTGSSGPVVGSGSGQPGPPGELSNWHAIFDDEFNGTSLNTAVWSTGWDGSGVTGPISTTDELECYDPSHVVEGSGEIDLNLTATPETCPTGSGPINEQYDSGMITTNGKFDYTYGYMEARVWMPGTTAITDWPAVWAQGQAGNWPTNGELDVVEGLGGSACWHFHDPSGGPGGCATGRCQTQGLSHTDCAPPAGG